MPLTTQWWRPLAEEIVQHEQDAPGVYELGDGNGAVVYVGSSNAIRRRLREHLGESGTSCIKRSAAKYRLEYTPNYAAQERQLYDEHVRRHGRPPQCNEVRP